MDNNRKTDIFKAISLFSQFGISMITPILLCVLGAKYLEVRFFEGQRWIILFGVILGVASSFCTMYKLIKDISKKKDE